MRSRMEKYYDDNVNIDNMESTNISSRTKRNQELYKEVSYAELEGFDLNSNVSVIGENTDNISLDEIKDILNEKYRENQRNKSFGDTGEISLPKINLDETREYDINSILKHAKEKKEVNYEEDRLKKIRNTQYDLFKNLDVLNNEEEIEEKEDIELEEINEKPKKEDIKEIHDLIDTITAKELINNEKNLEVTGELDPLDLLSDLRGNDESTKVMGALVKDEEDKKIDEDEDTLGIEVEEIDTGSEEKIEEKEETKEETETTELEITSSKKKKIKLDDSFIGSTTTFSQSDFEDFKDLKDDMKFTKIIIKLLVILVIIAFVIGCVVLANKFLNLGLF